MKSLFLDTNIVLDLLGERHPHYSYIAKIATLADSGALTLVTSALTYSTAYYILAKAEKHETALHKLTKFKILAETADLTDRVIDKSLASKFKDFEDAMQYYSALSAECDIIITRNGKDFKRADLPVMNAHEYLQSIKKSSA